MFLIWGRHTEHKNKIIAQFRKKINIWRGISNIRKYCVSMVSYPTPPTCGPSVSGVAWRVGITSRDHRSSLVPLRRSIFADGLSLCYKSKWSFIRKKSCLGDWFTLSALIAGQWYDTGYVIHKGVHNLYLQLSSALNHAYLTSHYQNRLGDKP